MKINTRQSLHVRRGLYLLAGIITLSFLSTSSFAQTQVIDFEDLLEGQVVSTVFGDGGFGPILVNGVNSDDFTVNAAVIFESSCIGGCTGGDPDLGSPNIDFAGPGLDNDGDPNMGGNLGSPFQNDKSLGNILIIHEHLDEIIGGFVADPDDDANITSITMEFPEPVIMYSFDMIDREFNETQNVELFGEGGVLLGNFDTPKTGDNGIATVYTDMGAPGSGTEGVVKMVMSHKGSGGLDNVVFKAPEPPGGGCTYTQGYWKTHPEAWPVTELTLGGVLYNQAELLDIFNTPVKGDKTISLAHQLIAAKLNIANAADPTVLGTTVADADAWLANNGGVGSGEKNWNGGEGLKNMLDDFNNGIIGSGHCDSVNSVSGDSASDNLSMEIMGEIDETPDSFGLKGNYPNPFNPQTTITFSLKETAQVRLSVYDMLGRELEVLVNGVLQAGSYDAQFEAGELPSGTYLYRLVTPEATFSGKMILSK